MDEGAAFGFFPQLRPRRRLQDPTASADVPLQVLRGRLAGLLGLPSDIGNLIRSPQPMEAFGSYDYEKPEQLPYTTEQFLKELPLAPTAPIGQLAGQAASFVPLNPAPLVRGAQKLGTMVGQGMAERVATGRPMLPSLLAEPQAAMFAVEPNVPRMNLLDTPPETMTSLLEVKPQAAVSDLGFYSAAEQAALNLQRNKGSGQAFLNDLLKAENVKKDELQWMGVDDFLKEKPNVTKQEVQDFIANNKVDVREVQLSGQGQKSPVFSEFNPDTNKYYVYSNDLRLQGLYDTQEEANKFVNEYNSSIPYGPSKYDKYQLPNGENYREILLTMPFKEPKMPKGYEVTSVQYDDGSLRYFANTPTTRSAGYKTEAEAQQALEKTANNLKDFRASQESYKSSHFNEPNILAHMRVNDRVDADGKKMLLIEEIQSDWHQAGREKGYKTGKESLEKWYNQNKLDGDPSFADLNSEQRNIIEQNRNAGMGGDTGVPDAPFKDTWYQLALKRALKYAADNGYERVGLTTGKQQAARFDLSKEIKTIIYGQPDANGLRKVEAITPSGDRLLGKRYTQQEIKDNVGSEIGEKINSSTGEFDARTGTYSLSGLDLSVGGEGMKKYYDEIYPRFLEKYGKKWNSKVGETRIKTGRGVEGGEPVRYIDITPEMKQGVSKGQPLFAVTPALPFGAQGLLGEPEKKKELSLLN